MNRLVIIGNLTRDPELRSTTAGQNVCNFTVAVNRRKGKDGNQDADFFRVSAWNQLGQNCQTYLAKGRKVAVVGAVSVRTYQGSDGQTRAQMEVLASDVEFLTPKGEVMQGLADQAGIPAADPETGYGQGYVSPAVDPGTGYEQVDVDDELPF